jgi:hypothetical protein
LIEVSLESGSIHFFSLGLCVSQKGMGRIQPLMHTDVPASGREAVLMPGLSDRGNDFLGDCLRRFPEATASAVVLWTDFRVEDVAKK